ncbi:hypothetical protein GF362_04345 [Candidatus Dojkabacteria bacterium]|nr:hypothetical protein [Candidatus Dojkabacteria bacterium]
MRKNRLTASTLLLGALILFATASMVVLATILATSTGNTVTATATEGFLLTDDDETMQSEIEGTFNLQNLGSDYVEAATIGVLNASSTQEDLDLLVHFLGNDDDSEGTDRATAAYFDVRISKLNEEGNPDPNFGDQDGTADGYYITTLDKLSGENNDVVFDHVPFGAQYEYVFEMKTDHMFLPGEKNNVNFSLQFESVENMTGEWQYVGNTDFSNSNVWDLSIETNMQTDETYVAFVETDNGSKASVMKFNGTSWKYVGSPAFTPDRANELNLAINPVNGDLYVAFGDNSNGHKASVMKFNGSTWEYVGTPGFSNGYGWYINIDINPTTGEPYVAYFDYNSTNKVIVEKFNGTTWENLPDPGVSSHAEFSINPYTSEPYLVYATSSGKLEVKKFDGSNWSTVGNSEFGFSSPRDINPVKFSPTTHQPYVAFLHVTSWVPIEYKPVVMTLNDSTWEYVCSDPSTCDPHITSGYGDNVHFEMSLSGKPTISYRGSNSLSVKYFDGENWEFLGEPNFVSGFHNDLSINSRGEVHVAQADMTDKVSVLAYK